MCGLFGVIDYENKLSSKEKEKLTRILAVESEARGTDAAGFAYVKPGGHMKIYKRPLPAHEMNFRLEDCNPHVIMGHTRFTTQGSEKFNRNNHPFYSGKMKFALAHNGVITNDKALRKEMKLPETKIETDSYIAVQLLEKNGIICPESIEKTAHLLKGVFSFTILTENEEIYIVRGQKPIYIAYWGSVYIYASERNILKKALEEMNTERASFFYDENTFCNPLTDVFNRSYIFYFSKDKSRIYDVPLYYDSCKNKS